MSSKVVIDLGFGDSGKGLTTSFLCSKTKDPIVVRFNGGQQAGHTVVYEGKRHVFSSFGSGSLQGVPTYWSKYCTFYPPSFLREYKMLDKPVIYVNPLCPVTTPFDIDFNRITENLRNSSRHGSVGMGFGDTIQRQEDYYKLFVQDLFYENVLTEKLKSIAYYYVKKGLAKHDNIDRYISDNITDFLKSVTEVKKIIKIADNSILTQYNPIFEGAQGIMLDMDFGFFPNVTRSNTTSKNAHEIYNSIVNEHTHYHVRRPEIYYITRSYLTRHGNGYMPDEKKLNLINNENETNKSHAYQGEFRTAELNIDLLNYALDCDNNFSGLCKKNLVITCTDQYPIDVQALLDKLNTEFNHVYVSSGPSLTDIKLFK